MNILDDHQVNINFSNLIFAGVDTTSNVLQWMMLHLAQNPRVQAKLRAEAETVESTLEWAKIQNRAVFVDFTADWCVNCKAFEKAYIDTESMAKVFASTNVIAAKADYTRKDPPLRAMLKALGRSGLPTYAIYFPDGSFDLLPNGPPLTLESRLKAAQAKLAK